MYSSSTRYSRLRHVVNTVTGIGGVGGISLAGYESYSVIRDAGLDGGSMRPGEIVQSLVPGILILCFSFLAWATTWLMLKIESHLARLHGEAHEIRERLETFEIGMKTLIDNTSISEAAKSIAYRSKERDALRAAINEEIAREDYDYAFHLIEDLESRLGYREEAERIRVETRAICTDKFRLKLLEAIKHVEQLFDRRNWSQAEREIQRLEKLMPGEARIAELWNELHRKREGYKQELLQTWNRAASESNIDLGMETLRELDQYLGREEAHSMAAQARELFRERLQQLGTQFQFAVKEKRWRDALTTGLEIMEEFPNVKMSKEIAERLPALRERAGMPADVDVTTRDS